ncbi:MAG: hypothetical protein IT435_10755 [Phycisphaerales bacterium]|nr:hypothetical protein [Phycisphaerales bacterium]
MFDTNCWKSFLHAGLAVPMGNPGCLSLFGTKSDPHRLIEDQPTSEYRGKKEGRGLTVSGWKLRVGGFHWLDCLVGATVAASMHGEGLNETDQRRSSVSGFGYPPFNSGSQLGKEADIAP